MDKLNIDEILIRKNAKKLFWKSLLNSLKVFMLWIGFIALLYIATTILMAITNLVGNENMVLILLGLFGTFLVGYYTYEWIYTKWKDSLNEAMEMYLEEDKK